MRKTAGSERAARDRRTERAQLYVPLVSLAVSLVLALPTGSVGNGIHLDRTRFTVAVLGLSAIAALWIWFVRVPYAEREARKVRCFVYYVGVIVLLALLVLVNPWFGFFGAAGYMHAPLLPGRWTVVGVGVTAALAALSQIGGIPHGVLIIGYVVVALANFALVGYIIRHSMREQQDDERRLRMLDELAEANRRLELAMDENAGLHAQLVAQAREAGVLDERRRMAGEIHDTLAQGLAGIVAQLEAADIACDDSERGRHLGLARDLARDSLAEARRSVQALRPGPLDDARLPEALTQLAEQWERTSGIVVRVEIDGAPTPLQPALEVVLFRAAQEALTNVAKHSGASRAGMTLTYTTDVVALDVLDDGAGFDAAATAPAASVACADAEGNGGTGYGLAAMRSRLRQVGGTLAIESAPGDGTTVSASVPAWGIEEAT